MPRWLLDGTKPTRLAWFRKQKLLPPIYVDLMLKGREWLARPEQLPDEPTSRNAQPARATEPVAEISRVAAQR